MQKIILYYLIAVNIIAFFLMAADKHKARKGAWRIPEASLFLSALIGGSVGAIVGMYIFRHKTRHMKFVIGMPAILLLQLIVAVLLLHMFD